ncbi:MAG: CNNM domain-containing protein, partial [Acidimicrobiales bacterium]
MVLALVAANGFFTAAEFALISVERSTIESMADSGNRRASLTLAMLRRLSFYLSGAQLGISLTALGLGFVAAPVAGELIEPLVDSVLGEPSPGLSVAVALVLATIFQTVMGELVPKIIAIAKPVRVALTLALPYRIVM